jgi:hypothetical protein
LCHEEGEKRLSANREDEQTDKWAWPNSGHTDPPDNSTDQIVSQPTDEGNDILDDFITDFDDHIVQVSPSASNSGVEGTAQH